MVAPSKELLNLSTLHSQHNNQNPYSTNTYQELSLMNIEDNIPSKQSLSPSNNRQKTMSVYSYTSSMDYAEQIQAQFNKLLWAEQLEMEEQSNSPNVRIKDGGLNYFHFHFHFSFHFVSFIFGLRIRSNVM